MTSKNLTISSIEHVLEQAQRAKLQLQITCDTNPESLINDIMKQLHITDYTAQVVPLRPE